jgi:hypothetical protein
MILLPVFLLGLLALAYAIHIRWLRRKYVLDIALASRDSPFRGVACVRLMYPPLVSPSCYFRLSPTPRTSSLTLEQLSAGDRMQQSNLVFKYSKVGLFLLMLLCKSYLLLAFSVLLLPPALCFRRTAHAFAALPSSVRTSCSPTFSVSRATCLLVQIRACRRRAWDCTSARVFRTRAT